MITENRAMLIRARARTNPPAAMVDQGGQFAC